MECEAACSVCAQRKVSHQAPFGLLRPLPIPGSPWSHIALNFFTGLPVSRGITVILTISDQFSKAAHCIALSKLRSARKTAGILVQHVFCSHGVLSVSLSFSFHSQTKGQSERTNQDLEAAIRCIGPSLLSF